jgi:hypothetical protein
MFHGYLKVELTCVLRLTEVLGTKKKSSSEIMLVWSLLLLFLLLSILADPVVSVCLPESGSEGVGEGKRQNHVCMIK